MVRSKLQVCTEILAILINYRSMKLTNLIQKIGLEETDLKNHLKLLLNSSLIELQNFGKKGIFYAATRKGLSILNIYNRIIKEEKKILRHENRATSLIL